MKNIKLTPKTKKSGIYCILNLKNQKIYVGSSNSIYFRLRCHLSHMRLQKHGNRYLQRSFNKYGEDSFYSFVLEYVEKDKLLELEDYYIKLLNADYNLIIVPSRHEPNEKVKKMISDTLKRKYKSGEIKTFDNPQSKIKVTLYTLDGTEHSHYESINECTRVMKFNKYTFKSIHLLGHYWHKNYIIHFADRKPLETVIEKYILNKKDTRFIPIVNLKFYSIIKIGTIRNELENNRLNIIDNQFCFIGANLLARVKSDKLLENPEEDNQQPI